MRLDFRKRIAADITTTIDDDNLDYLCLLREIDILRIFRTESDKLLPPQTDIVELYFTARHRGLPTRLLDWTTNPLVALFFAVTGEKDADGEVIAAMPLADFAGFWASQDEGLHPEESFSDQRSVSLRIVLEYLFGDRQLSQDLKQSGLMDVISKDIIGSLNDSASNSKFDRTVVLPITPDSTIARISEQKSRFTFHMPNAHRIEKERLKRCTVPRDRKSRSSTSSTSDSVLAV